MTDWDDLDKIRANVLKRIEREERKAKAAVIGFVIVAAIVEAAGIVGFLLLMDFKDRLHLLLGLMAAFIYVTLTCWILAVWAQIRHSTQRILKAIATGSLPES